MWIDKPISSFNKNKTLSNIHLLLTIANENGLQIRCGDLYASPAVEEFTTCAVKDKQCVGKRVDKEIYPVPPASAIVDKFDINKFTVSHKFNYSGMTFDIFLYLKSILNFCSSLLNNMVHAKTK